MNRLYRPLIHALATTASIVLLGSCLTAQAGQILEEPDGWDRSNVVVRIYDVDGILRDSVVYPDIDYADIFNWPDGYYESEIYDMTFIDGTSGETLMAKLVAKNPPVGVPPGVKVLKDQSVAPSQPESCIMATAVGVDCGSDFQTHKRYKVLMQPAMIDGAGSDSVDLVFRTSNIGDAVEEYRVFQKINNWTGERLTGFRLEVGFGVGTAFVNAVGSDAEANLSVEVDQYFTDPDKKTNFAHGLFGPIEPPNWNDVGAFTGGFFDDQSRAGYRIEEVDTGTYQSMPDGVTGGIFGKYEDVLPEDPVSQAGLAGFNQFGDWLPTVYMPSGVFFDDDDNPDTDDTLMAWWGYNTSCSTAPAPVNTGDYCWMYGDTNYYDWIDNQDPALGFVKDTLTTNYQPVSQTTFNAWASDSRYYIDTIDDLANLNLNYVVNVGTVDATWPTWNPGTSDATFTIRVTPLQNADIAKRTAQPGYMGTPHIPLAYTAIAGTVTIRPSPLFVPGTDTLTLTVTDADLNVDNMVPDTVDVVVENLDTGEVENNVTLTETGVASGVFTGTLSTGHAAADPGGDDNDIIYANHREVVQVTYVDASPVATLTAQTTAAPGHNGSVKFTAPVHPGSDILVQVDDLDLSEGTISVTLANETTSESEVVTLYQSPIAGQYVGSLPSSRDAANNADNSGTLVVAPGDVLVVSYTDAVAEDGSLDVVLTDTVTAVEVVDDGDGGGGGGGGGCTTGHSSGVHPTMPALLFAILGLGWLRHHRRSARD
jgi:acyl dehydratase